MWENCHDYNPDLETQLKPGWIARHYDRVAVEMAISPAHLRGENWDDSTLTQAQRRRAIELLRKRIAELEGGDV